MKAHCLPFSQIPHSSKLFLDFLAWTPAIRQFYKRSAQLSEWVREENGTLRYDKERRQRVAAILERQNRGWEASAKTLENIGRLREGASAVVTGQQVGLFGGPLFSIFKALTAVKLAEDATKAGVASVPIFWLATEDHDLAEVNQAEIPGPDGTLQRFAANPQTVPDAPVGAAKFDANIEAVTEAVAALLGDSPAAALLRNCYRGGETMGSAFARLFAGIFAEWGVILLDASDPELHAVSQPIYRAAAERAKELEAALLERGRALEAAGYHQQVKVVPDSTLLFTLQGGARVPIHRQAQSEDFVAGEAKVARAELLREIESAPQNFSANVLLRPIVQDYLLPTLVYTGGAAELAYFGQAAVVYKALLERVTPIIPRFSATLVEAKPQSLLERYGLGLPDVFQGPDRLRELLAVRTLPQELNQAFERAGAEMESSLAAIKEALARLDKTLVDSAVHAGEKMRYQLEQLRARAARAEVRQSEVLQRHAELLSRALYPEKTLQEREYSGIYFLARYGGDLLHTLSGHWPSGCPEHQVINL